MLMKTILLLFLMLPGCLFGQTQTSQSIDTRAGQSVSMTFEDAAPIRIEVWEQNTIRVDASVSINAGENDDAFQIKVDDRADALKVSTEIVGKKDLPERIMLHYQDQDHYFTTGDWSHPDVQAFLEKHGRENMQWMSHGPLINIALTVYVPKNIDLHVTSTFGLIEMQGVTQSLTASSEHGGLDLSVPSSASYDFGIECEWGEVYTNLNLEVVPTNQGRMLKAEQFVATLNGGGPTIRLTSEHGNVYLRAL